MRRLCKGYGWAPLCWKPIVLVLALFLGACGSLTGVRDQALVKGGQFHDQALVTAILWKCRAASIGSIERRYMRTTEMWRIWTEECLSIDAPEIPDRDEAEIEALPEVRPE